MVNGEVVFDISLDISSFCTVKYKQDVIQQKQALYFMMNKPTNVVSATKDKQHQTCIDLMVHPDKATLHLAGRLDLTTSGLLILTNDGDWSRRLTQPEEKIPKTYLVKTEGVISQEYVESFAKGMFFDYEGVTISPSILVILESRLAKLTIFEGRYHQVKRMFGRFNNKVVGLRRLSIGRIILDENLKPGEYRELNHAEINWLPST